MLAPDLGKRSRLRWFSPFGLTEPIRPRYQPTTAISLVVDIRGLKLVRIAIEIPYYRSPIGLCYGNPEHEQHNHQEKRYMSHRSTSLPAKCKNGNPS